MTDLRAVVSPTGTIHAAKPRTDSTVCGTGYLELRFGRKFVRRYWTRMKTSFDELNARRGGSQICKSCLETR